MERPPVHILNQPDVPPHIRKRLLAELEATRPSMSDAEQRIFDQTRGSLRSRIERAKMPTPESLNPHSDV